MKNALIQMTLLAVVAVVVVGFSLVYVNGGNVALPGIFLGTSGQRKIESVERPLIQKAKAQYKQSEESGVNMQSRVCLSEDLGGGFALEVAGEEEQENRCAGYARGETPHLIVISPEGEILAIN